MVIDTQTSLIYLEYETILKTSDVDVVAGEVEGQEKVPETTNEATVAGAAFDLTMAPSFPKNAPIN